MILNNSITFTFYIIDPINEVEIKNSIKTMSKLIYETFSNHNDYFKNIKPCIVHDKYTFTNGTNKWATIEIPPIYLKKNPYELFSDITKSSYNVLNSIDSITTYPDLENGAVIGVDENTILILIDRELFLRDSINLIDIANNKFDNEIRGEQNEKPKVMYTALEIANTLDTIKPDKNL